MNDKLTIEYLPLNKLAPAAYNPRTLTREAFISLQESIDQHGLVDPIICNKRNGKNIIVGGHQRLSAARELGFEEVPVVFVGGLDENHEKALNRRLNSRKSQGVDDNDMLTEMLLSIDEDMRFLSGDTDEEIQKLQDGWVDHQDLESETEPSNEPKIPKYTKAELKERVTNYRYQEHASIINAFLDTI